MEMTMAWLPKYSTTAMALRIPMSGLSPGPTSLTAIRPGTLLTSEPKLQRKSRPSVVVAGPEYLFRLNQKNLTASEIL